MLSTKKISNYKKKMIRTELALHWIIANPPPPNTPTPMIAVRQVERFLARLVMAVRLLDICLGVLNWGREYFTVSRDSLQAWADWGRMY